MTKRGFACSTGEQGEEKTMNTITIVGNLGADAEVRAAGDREVMSFRVASTSRWKDKEGNKQP